MIPVRSISKQPQTASTMPVSDVENTGTLNGSVISRPKNFKMF